MSVHAKEGGLILKTARCVLEDVRDVPGGFGQTEESAAKTFGRAGLQEIQSGSVCGGSRGGSEVCHFL